MPDYSVLSDALSRAKERSGATSADDAFLIEMLELSAGTDSNGVTQYRCFYVAAKFLEQNRSLQALDEAKGVKFTRQKTTIASLLNLQASIDKALGLTVPAGFESIDPNQPRPMRLQGTRSQATQTRP